MFESGKSQQEKIAIQLFRLSQVCNHKWFQDRKITRLLNSSYSECMYLNDRSRAGPYSAQQ